MRLPSYYEFSCPVKISAGHTALEKLPDILRSLGAQSPMILTDKGVEGAGLIDIVTRAMGDAMTIAAIETNIPPDSDVKVVERITRHYRKKGCDALIAVGGGSVLDTAKGVNILVSEESDDLMQFAGANVLKNKLKPLIAIPTTSGTGSEATLVAVIADHEQNKKLLFTSYYLLPDVAVLDSRMTLTLPPGLTAATGMDALTHAVEAYTCLSKNPISDACALNAISMICENLLDVVKKPGNKQGRLDLAIASTLAGMAFSNSMVGMVHSLGHSAGAITHAAHGTCMSILLPYGLEYNFHKIEPFASELLYAVAGDTVFAQTPEYERGLKTIAMIRQLNNDLDKATGGNHPTRLNAVVDRSGARLIPKSILPDIATTALGDGSILYNPEDLSYMDCLTVLEAAWAGEALLQ